MRKFNRENVLSGDNFAKHVATKVFAKNIMINNQIKNHINYDLSNIDFGDIIFCKTDSVTTLFQKIQNYDKSYKIKVITHESDYPINKKVFDLRPACIDKWYAVNVEYEHEDLIPIPIGLANYYCGITLKIEEILSSDDCTKSTKLLYVNNRKSTNPIVRNWIYEYFKNNDWCTLKEYPLSFEEYKKDLIDHKFMICPQGNGVDTHRLWECIYAGVVPVVENHIIYKNMQDLPILFVNSFREVDKEKLINFNLSDKKIEKIDIQYWKKLINTNLEQNI